MFTYTVLDTNTAPSITNTTPTFDNSWTPTNWSITGNFITGNFTDTTDTWAYTLVNIPNGGTIVWDHGTLTVSADGSFTSVSDANYQWDVVYDLSGMKIEETDGNLQSSNSFGIVTIQDHDKHALSFDSLDEECSWVTTRWKTYNAWCTLSLDDTDLSNASTFKFITPAGADAWGSITINTKSATDYILNVTTPNVQFVKIEWKLVDNAGNIETYVLNKLYNLLPSAPVANDFTVDAWFAETIDINFNINSRIENCSVSNLTWNAILDFTDLWSNNYRVSLNALNWAPTQYSVNYNCDAASWTITIDNLFKN